MDTSMKNGVGDNWGEITDSMMIPSGEITTQVTNPQSFSNNIFIPSGTCVQQSPSTVLALDNQIQLPFRFKLEKPADACPGFDSSAAGPFFQPYDLNEPMFLSLPGGDEFLTFFGPENPLLGPQAGFVMADPDLEPDETEEQVNPLRLTEPDSLSGGQVMFSFGVLCVMAQLSPHFEFKYGSKNGKNIGVKLTIYGHTVLIDPTSPDSYAARIEACRRALKKLKKYNPDWLFPPTPMDGPTSPAWNWIQLVRDYCGDQGWPMPGYHTTSFVDKWHCDVNVNGHLFRTVRQCDSASEAQNTAAHVAMYEILVTQPIDTSSIGSAGATSTETRNGNKVLKEKKGLVRAGIQAPPGKGGSQASRALDVPSNRPRTSRSRGSRGKKRKNNNSAPPEPAAKRTKKGPTPASVLHGANTVGLVKSRIAPLQDVEKSVEDPLAHLKAVQAGLEGISPDASYWSLTKKICEVLKAGVPGIRFQQNTVRDAKSSHVVRAWFDSSHPFLGRASPLLLAHVSNMGEDAAISLGMKKLILYLLDMLKEDAGITSSDEEYRKQLRTLRRLEVEIEVRISV